MPNLRTVSTLLRGCRAAGCVAPAERLVERMHGQWGIAPDAGCYEAVAVLLAQALRLGALRALVDQLGLFTAPATAFIVWGLFGLREIGTLIENPFTRSLQLQIVSDTLALDIQSAVDTAALDAARKRPPPPRKMPFPEAPPPPLPALPVTGNSEPVTGHAVGEGGGGAAADGPTSGHALG